MQSGITHDAAKAEATTDWKGQETVTVRATITLGEKNSQTTVTQLTRSAANSLLSDLLLITTPPRRRYDVHVTLTDGTSYVAGDVDQRVTGDRYRLDHTDGSVTFIERRSVQTFEAMPIKEN